MNEYDILLLTTMNLGIIIVSVVTLAYLSNWLNQHYLNYKITRLLYYVGAFIHETSHAVLCILTGAKIERFEIFSGQPRVIHQKSKLPVIGQLLISFAPVFGGVAFLFLVNNYLLGNYLKIAAVSGPRNALPELLSTIMQINIFQWQSLVMILLFINVGAMIGPSIQDMKNIWPVLIILFFINYAPLINFGLTVLNIILINIAIQIILISIIFLFSRLHHLFSSLIKNNP